MLSTQDIASISTTVCRDMLGLEFDQAPCETLDSILCMVAAIRISGDHEAIVEVATTPPAVTAVTAAMSGIGPENMNDTDLADALGEIVNIIGGNIKGALTGDTQLSLPCVNLKSQESGVRHGASSVQAHFLLEDQPFRVCVAQLH